MPLTDSSKSKVSLASLSATTAAAAETLWSKSKKSSKKKHTSFAEATVLPPDAASATGSSSNNSHKSSSVASPADPATQLATTPKEVPVIHHPQQPVDSHDFRRKFLEGLQFYCENSSLILNSDLPADLIEFVTSHGFSVESLGIILELKKSSSAFSAYVDKKGVPTSSSVLGVNSVAGGRSSKQGRGEQNFSETSRRLLQHWMSADSCAEAFVSLSLGEEIPGLIAERILFSVPDNFNISGKDFLTFLLSQVLLALQTLAFGVRKSSEPAQNDDEPVKVRSNVLASFLDRIFTRYFSDSEYFYDHTLDQHQYGGETKAAKSKNHHNPFNKFILELAKICKNDVIGRRIVSKILLHLSSHSASKVVKVIFSAERLSLQDNSASLILYPGTEFLEKNSQWKFVLQSLPLKTVTKSHSFWLNWAEFIESESRNFEDFWRQSVEHWTALNKSSLVDEHSLFSATLAIVALARQIKLNRLKNLADSQALNSIKKLELSGILQNIIHSLESINEKKRVCGMALAQVVADIQFSISQPSTPSPSTSSEESGAPKKLVFDCQSLYFLEILEFYNKGAQITDEEDSNFSQSTTAGSSHKIEVLDSDDDPEEEVEDDGFPEAEADSQPEQGTEIGTDPRILTLRSRKKKIPNYFSEIVETLLESSKNEDEAEILRYIVVLKIPVLCSVGVKVDSAMAHTICKCLLDMEDKTSLEVPIILSLYELFVHHPFEIAGSIGHVIFNQDNYTVGQRQMNLRRLTQIVLLASKQCCFNCYSKVLQKHEKELLAIYPEFIGKYFKPRTKLRFCNECRPGSTTLEEANSVGHSSAEPNKSQKELTWKEVVDQRVAAKTRYFFSPKSKTLVTVPDEYSSKLLPILWSSVANRLSSKAALYLDKDLRAKSGNLHDMFLVNVFQYLTKCILGTSGPNCPHIHGVAAQVGELVTHFVQHEDAIVRRSALSLLGVTLSVGEGKVFVIEALSSQGNVFQLLDQLLQTEKDPENHKFIKQIQIFFASCSTTSLLDQQLKLFSLSD